MIIGIAGTNGSGKDTVADYLKKKGYFYHSLSDIIRDELKLKGKKETRENLIEEGNNLRKKHGPAVLAKMIREKLDLTLNHVIVSIRNEREIKELRKLPEFKFIFIDAPIDARYKRVQSRGEERDKESFEKFKADEAEEMGGKDEAKQQLSKCIELADRIIINEGTLEELYSKAEDLTNDRS